MNASYKTALVTGASTGIGAATAKALASSGWRVIALARRMDKLTEVVADCGPSAVAIAADVTDTESVAKLVARHLAAEDGLDLLVNNAGLALGLNRADEADTDHWETMIDVNCRALVKLTRALLPGMRRRNRGHIINMGSIAGVYPYRGSNVYGATKAFVAQFSLNLRADLLGSAVRCTLIEPGMVGDSEFSLVRFEGNAAKANAVYAGSQPLLPADVANAVVYAAEQPPHVNINRMELMPTCQAVDSISVVKR